MTVQAHADFPVGEVLARVDPTSELPPCGLRRLVLGGGAIDTVADVVAGLVPVTATTGRARVVLLVDPVTILRDGVDVKDLVESALRERFDVRRVVLDDGHPELHVVDPIIGEARVACAGADAVVALGGGTISDIGKLAAVASGPDARPPALVTVQTAASVDGYTDDVSVILRDGVKRTVPSRWPDAVLGDAETIAGAPTRMNRAGFGEMTSMFVAPADWRLASLVGAETKFHRGPVQLLHLVGADMEEWSAGVRRAEPDAVAKLTQALDLRGIATGVAGTTAALSGVEHLVSHMIDQHQAAHHLPTGLHGAQVGAASVVAAAAWEMLFDRMSAGTPEIDTASLDLDAAHARIDHAFGALDGTGSIAGECWQDYSRKLAGVTENLPRVRDLLVGWADHEGDLRDLVRPSVSIASGLRAAGSPATFAELDPIVSDDLARWAVGNAQLMRNRFTLVDLLTLLGWWAPGDVDEVFARAEAALRATTEEESR